ncbi:MAG TPA: response regulator [Kofleriaceae bacterium]|nr:response regulator [Kofleriaceae bacterium]
MEVRVDSRRLLLIDDSEIALAYAESVLLDVGFDVRAVSSLKAFQDVLADWKPHLIVTDLYMPEMNGAELCQWLRRQVATARIPIVICSSAPDEELAQVARQVGADAYLSKLAGLDALPERLNMLCDEILW